MFSVLYFVGPNLDKNVYKTSSKQDACSFAIRTSRWTRVALVYENEKFESMYKNGVKQ